LFHVNELKKLRYETTNRIFTERNDRISKRKFPFQIVIFDENFEF